MTKNENVTSGQKKLLPSNTSQMKTHVHQYDILHAGETPMEDVSVANIKHKKGLEKDK